MSIDTIAAWSAHLRAIARPAASRTEDLGAGPIERPLLASVGASPGDAAPRPVPAGEVGLWWACVDRSVEVDDLIAAPTDGSLLPRTMFHAIEVWTEADLCALHALWRLARDRRRPDWSRRCDLVRDWHLDHTQPDNATNRPWALHVFLLDGRPEATLYAETLLHNSMAVAGRPDPLSAWILLDVADRLDSTA